MLPKKELHSSLCFFEALDPQGSALVELVLLEPLMFSVVSTVLSCRAHKTTTVILSIQDPEPGEDPQNGSTLTLYSLHHRSIRLQNWELCFFGSSQGSGEVS